MFKFRWKKPKDWKNSLKIMTTTETTQNTTGDYIYGYLSVWQIHFFLFFPFFITSLVLIVLSGAALCRSDFVTEKRKQNWTSETGRGRRRNWRRSDRGFSLKVTPTLMLSCREWVHSNKKYYLSLARAVFIWETDEFCSFICLSWLPVFLFVWWWWC